MKKILCFGDSNTYGYNPETGGRFGRQERWCGILQSLCGKEYAITEAGCNNRTCFRDNFDGKKFTGYRILPEFLAADKYDLIILWIGTNDLQRQYNVSINEIQYGIENLIEIVQTESHDSKILIIPPLKIGNKVLTSKIFSSLFNENSIEKSKYFYEIYSTAANKYNCEFLSLENTITPSNHDGLHFDKNGQKKIADTIYKNLNRIFKQ